MSNICLSFTITQLMCCQKFDAEYCSVSASDEEIPRGNWGKAMLKLISMKYLHLGIFTLKQQSNKESHKNNENQCISIVSDIQMSAVTNTLTYSS
jgi:hypothetical protein